jgi:hypothetical protein
MRTISFRFFKQVLPSSAAALGLLGLVAISNPAMANDYTLCPSGANQGGIGQTFTDVSGPLDGTCGANSAVTMSIPVETDYARLLWDSSVTNYPPGLTLGTLDGISADIPTFSGQPGDQPYYMLAFTDATDGLGQGAAGDQILMIEFQSSTLSGTSMVADPNATLFNLYDNTTGTYLGGGQSHTNTLAGWIAADSFLSSESLQQVRLGIGLSGGGTSPESITVNSLDIMAPSSVPEPRSFPLLLIAAAAMAWGIRARRQAQSRRS